MSGALFWSVFDYSLAQAIRQFVGEQKLYIGRLTRY